MSQDHQFSRQEPPVSADSSAIQSVDQLVRARESRGLAQSDLAARLGMTTRQIQAIERGDWRALPGRSFARSAMRAYGRVLAVSIEPILPAIDAEYGIVSEPINRPALDKPMPRRGVLGFSSSGPGHWLTWTILIVVGLVVVAFYFGGGASLLGVGDANESTGSQTSVAEVAPIASSTVAVLPPPMGDSNVTTSVGTSSGPAQVGPPIPVSPAAPSADPASAISAAGQVAKPAPQSITSSGMALQFSAPAWIEIRDGEGRVVATGTQQGGTTRALEIKPPVSAVIGNPGAVTVLWQGAPYDLTPHIRQGVARFQIEGAAR